MHSNLFNSPVWPVLYPEKITERLHKSVPAGEYLFMPQINSGHSKHGFSAVIVGVGNVVNSDAPLAKVHATKDARPPKQMLSLS